MLADAAPERAGEDPGLERRDPHLAVELGAPRLLVFLDPQAEATAVELVAGCRALARAPLRQVVRDPLAGIERAARERVLELELVRVDFHPRDPSAADGVDVADALVGEELALPRPDDLVDGHGDASVLG